MTAISHPAGITTLHRLRPEAWPALEQSLGDLTQECPVTLLLPCHVKELGTESLDGIIRELTRAFWIKQIVVGVDGGSDAEFKLARQIFSGLPCETTLLQTASPAVWALEEEMRAAGLTTASSGKGRNVWLCAGRALADGDGPGVVAVHDCDIRDYTRELPGRLCHPLLERRWGFRFNKGFYSRYSDRLHGRVQRLLVRPLLRAMELRAGPVAMLQFLSAFRYPLAGESAFDRPLLAELNFPASWGLEMGLLAEIARRVHPRAVCQTELCGAYDHKHHDLSPEDPDTGLHRMAREVSDTLLSTVSGGTYPWREQILETWQEMTTDALRHASAESVLNGLPHSMEQETLAVSTFRQALQAAADEPAPPALLPSWRSATRALPHLLTRLAGISVGPA